MAGQKENQTENNQVLFRDKHIEYFLKALKKMPSSIPLRMAETSRLHMLFFIVSGLDLLNGLHSRLTRTELDNIIDAVYSFQVDVSKVKTWHQQHCQAIDDQIAVENLSKNFDEEAWKVGHAGFRATCVIQEGHPIDTGNIAMTYCALASLIIMGDDLSRVDCKSIVAGMRYLQLDDGSFKQTILGGENDMRVVYCACAVAHLLNDWSGMDRDKCCQFIINSLSYEGAFGQCPGTEAHGGSTYCALASLTLMGRLDGCLDEQQRREIVRWCLNKYSHGFCGRPNKDQDTCYSFWIGASLVMLNQYDSGFFDHSDLVKFILSAQEETGGISKVPELYYPDPLHTYLSLAGLTLIDISIASKFNASLLPMDPTLNISRRALKVRQDNHLNNC